MKIIVCIKQVPAKDSTLRIADGGAWIRDTDISFEINEPDAYALEAALRLKEQHGGEVVAMSAGPSRVQTVLREALAKGADRAILLEDDAFARLDAYNGAKLLAKGLAVAGESYDLLFTGLQSDDLGYAQTGVILAELAGLPSSTITMDVQPQASQVQGSGRLRVKRELEAGWFQWVDMPMPAVLSIQSGLAKLRYATLMGIKKAKTKEIKRLTKVDLGWNDADWAPTQVVRRVYVPQKSKQTQFIEGTAKEAAAKLVEKLRFEARVI